jgi:hypothetical protein
MKEKLSEYVYLDGMLLKEEQLLKLSKNVGCYAQAEHYLFALLAHGVINGKREVIDMVNEVREFYGVPKIPVDNQESTFSRSRADSLDDKARMLFKKMPLEKRREILKEGLNQLVTVYHLFKYKVHWLGIFLVIRDRLEGESLKLTNLYEYAQDITPDELPKRMRLKVDSVKNFSKKIVDEDRGEAYYDMRHNPQKELCDKLWDIMKQIIFANYG